jgi:thymidylate synthase (FAD)
MNTNFATLEQLRWKKFPVLDDGFVCLVDAMGDDQAVVQAARVSYQAGTRAVSDDRTLIRYLMRHRHTTPFEMAEVKLLIRVPMDCWRQWIRHRTASINETSTRYSIAIDASQTTPPDQWRLQAANNRQGSAGFLDAASGEMFSVEEAELQGHAKTVYRKRLERGIAREQARKDLPLSTYTEAYWKIDLHNLLHFLELRMDPLAQQEIRDYANVIGREIVRPLFPSVWEGFEDYRLHAMDLSRLEQAAIEKLAAAGKLPADEESFLAACDPAWKDLPRCRERDECRAKLVRLGLMAN